MNAYAYNADLFCEPCGMALRRLIPRPFYEPPWDTNDYPLLTPFGGGEADSPQHCAECHEFLGNALTADGMNFVRERLAHAPENPAVKQWGAYYGLQS